MIEHSIDPVLGRALGMYLWWYGLSYTLGFISLLFWLLRRGRRIGMPVAEARSLTIAIATGVLLGGRLAEVLFYEREFYFANPELIPAAWLGGMSTHGILLGAVLGAAWHCRGWRRRFMELADELAAPGACIMGLGRIGNFIDGQIAGAATDLPWGVLFPDFEGARHPVVLYDGAKNLLLFGFLLWLVRRRPPRGAMLGHFIFWYGFLRIFVDLFREYRVDLLGFPPGQEFNLLMALIGGALLLRAYLRMPRRESDVLGGGLKSGPEDSSRTRTGAGVGVGVGVGVRVGAGLQWAILFLLMALPAAIPSDWTYDIPEHYAHRHPGMERTTWYPKIAPPE